MGCVVGPVGDGPHHGQPDTEVVADLGHGGPFHLHREGVRQFLLQRLALRRRGHEAVSADQQPLVQPGGLQTEGLHRRRRQQGGKAGDHALAGHLQRFRDQGIGLETGSALTRHLVAREQGRCVHVVLQELPGQHQVAHPHARAQVVAAATLPMRESTATTGRPCQ